MRSTILSFHELNWYYFIVCSCCWQWNCISSYTLPGGAYILCHLWNRVDFKHSIHKENELLTKSLFVHRFPISDETQWKTSYFCSWVMQLSSPEHYTWSSTANQVNQYPHQTDLFRLKTVYKYTKMQRKPLFSRPMAFSPPKNNVNTVTFFWFFNSLQATRSWLLMQLQQWYNVHKKT